MDNKKHGKFSWKRTNVDIKNHVFVPDLDLNMESPDEFVEDFMSEISKIPMDLTKPLWVFYILNVKTSKANSTVIFKIHHSMGDGVSLISLLMECAKKTSESNLPTIFSTKKRKFNAPNNGMVIKRLFMNVWKTFLIIFNTLVDLLWILATIMFLKDTKTPIKGERGIEFSAKRFVHRIIDFDDIKLVKTAMNVTVNDVATGVAEAGLTRYLNMKYGQLSKNNAGYIEKANLLPRNLRLRSIVCFNLRASPIIEDLGEIMEEEKELKGKWGNIIGIALVPLTVDVQDDPLTYVRRAKATMDQKKLSLEPKCISMAHMLLTKLFGIEPTGMLINAIFLNTTLFLSNMVGPREEITPFGHPLSYIAPTISGFPQVSEKQFVSSFFSLRTLGTGILIY
ncbi:o-acyltransferase wsd1 [Phtheirospermum japonicum]|uniref:O-acyltransferase wsd1 n=1 Tax=Phtheirospermum japonicum TaxID=374723 RepID=A0A830BGE9_9LAMI|nr:o-acyltransferase wsd1 [Phtheirospermum japonicum]